MSECIGRYWIVSHYLRLLIEKCILEDYLEIWLIRGPVIELQDNRDLY